MKIRPILFSPEMSAAVREGRKTMTRRIVKDEGPFIDPQTYQAGWRPSPADCPYGKVGDILYGRERFHKHPDTGEVLFPDSLTSWIPLKPSIHMPRDAARIWLRITNVRVERLADISREDAIAEGISMDEKDKSLELGPYYAFRELWDSINGHGSWVKNPWVWVIEFTPCEKPSL